MREPGWHRGRTRGAEAVLAGAMAALSLAGCGLKLPTATDSTANGGGGTATRSTQAPASGSTRRLRAASAKTSASSTITATAADATDSASAKAAELAVRAFAAIYINWNAQDFASLLERLGNSSTGQAQETMLLDAAEVARDSSLRADGISNSGTVEAVAPVTGATVGRYVVVTCEQAKSAKSSAYAGVGPSWHVTLATVTRVGSRWVVSDWRPES